MKSVRKNESDNNAAVCTLSYASMHVIPMHVACRVLKECHGVWEWRAPKRGVRTGGNSCIKNVFSYSFSSFRIIYNFTSSIATQENPVEFWDFWVRIISLGILSSLESPWIYVTLYVYITQFLSHSRYKTLYLKQRVQHINTAVQVAMSTLLSQVQEQLQNTESSMRFMQAEHAHTLRGLHDEIHKLQNKCSGG
jgi:hypothetical protein